MEIKRFNDYSEKELSEIKNIEEIEAIVKFECEASGIEMIDSVEKPEIKVIEPDTKVYVVSRSNMIHYRDCLMFNDKEDAEAVAEIINKLIENGKVYDTEYFHYLNYNEHAVCISDEKFNVYEVCCYSSEQAMANQADLEENKKKLEKFSELTEMKNSYDELRDMIFEAVYKAYKNKRNESTRV